MHKIDPADWYLEVVGIQGTGQGLMFGVIAQSIIGWGAVELALRGIALGTLFALMHRAVGFAQFLDGHQPAAVLFTFTQPARVTAPQDVTIRRVEVVNDKWKTCHHTSSCPMPASRPALQCSGDCR